MFMVVEEGNPAVKKIKYYYECGPPGYKSRSAHLWLSCYNLSDEASQATLECSFEVKANFKCGE